MWKAPDNGSVLILVADDDAATRLVACAALESAGFSVVEAADGREAVACFDARHPQIVLMDVVMPIMDGFLACRAIREMPGGQDTPILMLTGLEDVESINRAYEAGATDFATKPVPWAILVHRVRYMLRARSAVDDLRESEERLAEAQRIALLGNWERDLNGYDLRISKEACRILGMESGAPTPTLADLLARIHAEVRPLLTHAAEEMSRGRESESFDLRVPLADGSVRYVHHQAQLIAAGGGRPARIVGTFQDITVRRGAEERVRFLAHYDELTQLPNRLLLVDRLRLALAGARRVNRKVATMFIDLDRFKRINDTLGHSAGDELLAAVAGRLRSCVRGSDSLGRSAAVRGDENTIARFGGDEFILVLPGLSRDFDAARVARRVLEALREPFHLKGHEVSVGGSIGISLFPDDGDDGETLLRNADTAMYSAKESGRGRYQFYTESMNTVAFQRLSMEASLRKAIERSEFELYYQPQVDLNAGRIVGAEALIRWNHPDLGFVAPNEFIPLAEETGLIVPIGGWVLKSACLQAQAWLGAGLGPLRMAVNLSGHQLLQKGFVPEVASALRAAGLGVESLEIEITESILMRAEAVATLNLLKEMGLRISIDDFGTGYSSLAYLRRFPVDALKIDRSFVRGIAQSSDDAAVTGAIITMARSLKLEAVAEGVETSEQLEILRLLRCPFAQGFLFGRPVTAAAFESLLRDPTPVTQSLQPAPA